MMKLTFKNFIKLTRKEHEKILSLRNADYIRNNMKTKNIIKIENHMHWIDKLKYDNSNKYYAVYRDDEIVGAIYIKDIDYNKNKSTWGIYFKKNINPLISSVSAYCIIDKIFNELNLNILDSEVKKNNISAYKFNLSLGFKVYGENIEKAEEYYLMKIDKQKWIQYKNSKRFLRFSKILKKINIKIDDG